MSADAVDGENSNPEGNEDKFEQPLREQDRFLPIANIAKIMKRAIPDTGKVLVDHLLCHNILRNICNILFVNLDR